MNEKKIKDREPFWNGFYFWFIIQFMLITMRITQMVMVSWWWIFTPTYLVVLGGIVFAVYFWFTCDPRIEKDKIK